MAKITKIENDIITISTVDGITKEINKSEIDFEPEVGIEVEISDVDGNVIVKKKEVDDMNTDLDNNTKVENDSNLAVEATPEVAPVEPAVEAAPEVAPVEQTVEAAPEVAPVESPVETTPEVASAETAVEATPEVAPVEPTAEGMPTAQTSETPNPDGKKEGKLVNKTIYCLLAFFLGGIGVHKFYTGKTALGVVYFLFCWTMIPGLIAFVEFIIALTKKADAEGNILM